MGLNLMNIEKINKSIVDNVLRFRKDNDLSNRQFAKNTGITSTAVYLIVEGGRSPSLSTLTKLSECMSISIGELIGEVKVESNRLRSFYNKFHDKYKIFESLDKKDMRIIEQLAVRLSHD